MQQVEPPLRASEDTRDLREVLGIDQVPLGRTGMKFGALVLLLVAIVASVVWFAATRNSDADSIDGSHHPR